MALSEDSKNIRAVLIIEVIGKPKEYLKETLEGIVKKIKEEKGVELEDSKINEPQEMEKKKGFYSSFAEIEIIVEEMLYLVALMFKYMPAHIEVISPEKISMKNNEWSETLSELVKKLHGYDEVARITLIEKEVLEKKLRDVLEKGKEKKVRRIN